MTGTVYLIQAGGPHGPIKVGFSTDPIGRARHLQTGHYEDLTVVASFPGTPADEAWIHDGCDSHRMRGEWFEWSEHLQVVIDAARVAKDFHSFLLALGLIIAMRTAGPPPGEEEPTEEQPS